MHRRRVFGRQQRELRRLHARWILDGARARDAHHQVKSSARRTLARPAMLFAPLTAGALVALALTRRKEIAVEVSSEDPLRKTGLIALVATGLRVWSRSAVVRNLLKPVVRSVVNAPPQTVVAPRPAAPKGSEPDRRDKIAFGRSR